MGGNQGVMALKRAEKAQQYQRLAGDLHVYMGSELVNTGILVYHKAKAKFKTPN